jgi:hypothetical protein
LLAARCFAFLSRKSRPRKSSHSPPLSLNRPTRPWRPHRRTSATLLAHPASRLPRRSKRQNEHVSIAGHATEPKSIEPNRKTNNHCCTTRRRSTGTTLATQDERHIRQRLRKLDFPIMRGIANGRSQHRSGETQYRRVEVRGSTKNRDMMRESLPTKEGSVEARRWVRRGREARCCLAEKFLQIPICSLLL